MWDDCAGTWISEPANGHQQCFCVCFPLLLKVTAALCSLPSGFVEVLGSDPRQDTGLAWQEDRRWDWGWDLYLCGLYKGGGIPFPPPLSVLLSEPHHAVLSAHNLRAYFKYWDVLRIVCLKIIVSN